MKVSELKIGQGKVDIQLEIKNKGNLREFEKYGKMLKVSSAEAVDSEGGKITLSLWNEDAEKVNTGDFVKITNGYVSEYNGQKQLSSGKFGKIEVVGAEGAEKPEKKAKKEEKSSEKEEEDFGMDEVEF